MRRGLIPAGLVHQECGAGVLPITVEAGGRATVTGGQPTLGEPLDPAPLLAAVGLGADECAGAASADRRLRAGVHAYLPVRPEAVAAAQLTYAAAGLFGISVFAWDAERRTAHARVFVPGSGVPEDPATGSAAMGMGVWLVSAGLLPARASRPM